MRQEPLGSRLYLGTEGENGIRGVRKKKMKRGNVQVS